MLASKWSGKKWKVTPQQPKGEYPTGFGEDVAVYPEQVISAEKSDLPLSTAPGIDEYLKTLPQPSVKDAYSEQRRRLGLTLGAVESIASPITEPLRSGIESEKKFGTAGQELLKGKIGEGLADALLAAGQGAVSLGQLSNPEIAVTMQALKGANEILPESVSRYINEPITSLSKDLGGQVKPEMEKYTKVADMLAQLLGFAALHKGASLLSKEGLRYEDQNQEASRIPTEQGEPVIRGTEEQAQRGTPQRASEGVQPEETPQANARIISTAVKTPEGIITGDKPFDAHDTISETKGVVAPEKNRGFVIEDAQGKQSFVGREEAAKVAQEAGQIKEPVKELHSEDLRKAQSSKPSEETIPTKEAGKTQRVSSLKPIEGTGELKQRGLAKSTEAAAIASGITKGFENLPEYRVLSNAPQVQKAAQIIANDPQQAMRMVTGKEKTPDDVLPGFLYAGLKDKALKGELPPETLQQLAQSDWLAKQGTTAGQIVQSFKNQDPLDPIKSLNDIVKSREELFAKKTGRENIEATKERVVNQISRETKKNNLQFRDWNEFINNLVCK